MSSNQYYNVTYKSFLKVSLNNIFNNIEITKKPLYDNL